MALITVNLHWDDEYGQCYNCGLPAAFAQPLAYGESSYAFNEGNFVIEDKHKLCAVCAANAAAEDHELIVRIEDHEDKLVK